MEKTVNTYGSNYEEKLCTATGGIRKSDRDDQYFVERLIRKMGDSSVFMVGSSTALCRGFRVKLNRDDYGLVAAENNGELSVPVSFPAEYYGFFREAKPRSLISVRQIAAAMNGYSVFTDTEQGICILQSPGVDFSDITEENDAYRARMKRFWEEPLIPEPRVNVEQTRVVVSEAPYPQEIPDWRNAAYVTCYSPAILCRREENGKAIYISNEFSTVRNWKELDTVTVIKKSTDDGKTWNEVARIPHIRWAGLQEHNGVIYLTGTNGKTNTVDILRFYRDMTYEILQHDFGCGWTSPNTVLEHNGRVYQALGTAAISAPLESDLLDAANWTVSGSLKPLLTREWFLKESGEAEAGRFTVMEGNMLESPDGKIYNIMRTETQPNAGYAAILELTEDGTQYRQVPSCNSLLHFPTSVSKFVIHRDELTGYYFSLTSCQTIEGFGDQRSILMLVWSEDLFHWKKSEVLLVDREMMNPVCSAYAHSFQYVDFVIDGEDILMAVREAAGKTNIWHDGTHITFYRIKHFRKYAL